jgi:urease accessory protein UreF
MEALLSAPMTDEESAEFAALGLDTDNIDRRAALAVGIYKKACEGDIKAYSLIAEMLGEKHQTAEEKEETQRSAEQMREILGSMFTGE